MILCGEEDLKDAINDVNTYMKRTHLEREYFLTFFQVSYNDYDIYEMLRYTGTKINLEVQRLNYSPEWTITSRLDFF